MSISIRVSFFTLSTVLASTFVACLAHADSKAECVGAYEQTQKLRADNKLRAAREQLLVCTRATCPKLVRLDCVKWMEEVTASVPSVVFAARDGRGGDRSNVRVFLDGEPVTSQLGQEVVVDPGVHKVRAEAPGAQTFEQEVVIVVGEKARAITLILEDAVPEAPPPTAPSPPMDAKPATASNDESRPMPVVVPVLGGLGIAAIAGAAYLTLSTSSQLDDLRTKCAPHCEQSDVDALNLRYRIGAGAAGVGVIAIGAAIYMFVTRPTAAEKRAATIDVSPSGILLRGRF